MATQKFVEVYLNSISIDEFVTGAAQPKITQQALNSIQIPLPDIDIQQAIVAEIEAEQSLVAANRELVARFEKKIQTSLARVWGMADASVSSSVRCLVTAPGADSNHPLANTALLDA